jgi:hypothetical protein
MVAHNTLILNLKVFLQLILKFSVIKAVHHIQAYAKFMQCISPLYLYDEYTMMNSGTISHRQLFVTLVFTFLGKSNVIISYYTDCCNNRSEFIQH